MRTFMCRSPTSVTVISGTVGSAAATVKFRNVMFSQLSIAKAVISPWVTSRAPFPSMVTFLRFFEPQSDMLGRVGIFRFGRGIGYRIGMCRSAFPVQVIIGIREFDHHGPVLAGPGFPDGFPYARGHIPFARNDPDHMLRRRKKPTTHSRPKDN